MISFPDLTSLTAGPLILAPLTFLTRLRFPRTWGDVAASLWTSQSLATRRRRLEARAAPPVPGLVQVLVLPQAQALVLELELDVSSYRLVVYPLHLLPRAALAPPTVLTERFAVAERPHHVHPLLPTHPALVVQPTVGILEAMLRSLSPPLHPPAVGLLEGRIARALVSRRDATNEAPRLESPCLVGHLLYRCPHLPQREARLH